MFSRKDFPLKGCLLSAAPLLLYVTVFYTVFYVADLLLWYVADLLLWPIIGIDLLRWIAALVIAMAALWLSTTSGRMWLARRRGRVHGALRRPETAQDELRYEEALKTLRAVVPAHPVRDALIQAYARLSNLNGLAWWARHYGVERTVIEGVEAQFHVAYEAVWRSADRLAAHARSGSRRAEALDAEAEHLAAVLAGIKQAELAIVEVIALALREDGSGEAQQDRARTGLAPLAEAVHQLDDASPLGS